MSETTSCAHCLLPVREDGQQREVDGEYFRFCCYGCCLAFQVSRGRGEESEAAWLLIRLGVGAFLAMFIMLFSLLLYSGTFNVEDERLVRAIHMLLWALSTPMLLILGAPFVVGAWRAARRGRANADTLVSIGVLSAYGYSVLQTIIGGDGVYFDTAAMVLVLFTIGRFVEAESRARTARNLAPMLAAERVVATVVGDDGLDLSVSAGELRPGMIVRVKPGERIPVDGTVMHGLSQCDEAILTGRYELRTRSLGDDVLAGSLNGDGQLLIRTTLAGTATLWAQINRVVSEALQRKSMTGKIVDGVAAVFVPAVMVLAITALLYWNQREGFENALMIALAVLVVACPCALGLATPLATALGLGRAARYGVLIRGGAVLERLAGIKGIAFDKTGTLTAGKPRVVHLETERKPRQTVLALAAGLAQGSEHPLARGIAVAARSQGIEALGCGDIQARPGQGVVGRRAGTVTAMGSAAMMAALGWRIPAHLSVTAATTMRGCTLVYIGRDSNVWGLAGLADTILSDAREVVSALGKCGLDTCLLSGDNPASIARAATTVNIGAWRAELTPQLKVDALAEWSRQRGSVAMVGDGLNDGPALAAADVGIAVDGATDLTREAADVTLPQGALQRLPWLVQLARRVRHTIYTNIAWALGYNMLALTLAATGLLTPIVAAVLMAGSSLVVSVNSLRVARDALPKMLPEPVVLPASKSGYRPNKIGAHSS